MATTQSPAGGLHTEHEDQPWAIAIPDHPTRADSPTFVAARAKANELVRTIADFYYGSPPYQMHHGGSLWVKDAAGWFLVRNIAGIEWSAQFCADPAKVDQLRLNAQRIYAGFPEAVAELGIAELLSTPITDASTVAVWTDSICNSCVPLRAAEHTGLLPQGGGEHHYPTPITDIQFFKHADFNLWVSDPASGTSAAVVPVAPRGSGESSVEVVYAQPGTALHHEVVAAHLSGERLIVDGNHTFARQAFSRQRRTAAPARGGRRAARAGTAPTRRSHRSNRNDA